MDWQESRPCFQALSLTPATSNECLLVNCERTQLRCVPHQCVPTPATQSCVNSSMHTKSHAHQEPWEHKKKQKHSSYIRNLNHCLGSSWALYSNPATSVRREEKVQVRHSGAHLKSQHLKVWGKAERQVSLGYTRSLCQKTEGKRR